MRAYRRYDSIVPLSSQISRNLLHEDPGWFLLLAAARIDVRGIGAGPGPNRAPLPAKQPLIASFS